MQRHRLGRTGLEVSVASLGSGGASRLGQGSGASHDESVRLVRAALDGGINAIDTAAGYGTEGIVGAAVTGRRDEVVISTKSGIFASQLPPFGEVVPGRVFAERVEQSLSNLQTDHIDIMHVHGLRPDTYDYCVGEILPAMHRLRDDGKIRFIGVTEAWRSDATHQMLHRALDDDYFDVVMIGLNVLNHSATASILPALMKNDVGTQCMCAVRGKLASPEQTRTLVEAAIAAGEVDPAAVDLDNPLGFLAEPGVAGSLAEACYRFAAHTPGIDTVLTGTGSVTHLRQNIAALDSPPLPAAALARVERLFAGVRSVTGD